MLAESPDQIAAVEDCFRRATETALGQQSKGWELRATMSLARLRQRHGRRDEARGHAVAKRNAAGLRRRGGACDQCAGKGVSERIQ